MAELRLSLINISEFRELQTGSPEIENYLMHLVQAAYPLPEPRPRKILGFIPAKPKLIARPVDPAAPTQTDARNLARGKFIAPDRLDAAWTLTRSWLDSVAWANWCVSITEAQINEIDFELASWGVETHFALRRLLNNRLSIPLRNPQGQVSGYVKYDQAVGLRQAWGPALSSLSPGNRNFAAGLCQWLGSLEQYAANARQRGRKAPDLLAWYSGF